MLQAFVPVALVLSAVVPIHLAIASFLVRHVMTFVNRATVPPELAVSILLVLFVAALVLVAVLVACLLPHAVAVLLSIEELAGVVVAVGPGVLTKAFSLSVEVFSNVCVAN